MSLAARIARTDPDRSTHITNHFLASMCYLVKNGARVDRTELETMYGLQTGRDQADLTTLLSLDPLLVEAVVNVVDAKERAGNPATEAQVAAWLGL